MRAAVSLGLIGVSFAACSSSGGGSSPSVSQAASDMAAAVCNKLDACASLVVKSEFDDVATCTSRETPQYTNALMAPGTGWTPSALEACAQALPGASCDDVLSNNAPSACHPPAGQLASGAACGDDAQCMSSYCNLGSSGKCGTCAAALGAAGAACYRDGDCAYATVCIGADVTKTPATAGTCATRGESGATCDDTHPCLLTLACIADATACPRTGCTQGTCGAPSAAGASCVQVGASNGFGNCNELAGDYCSAKTNGTCTAISFASAGQPCGVINNALTSCSASGTCPSGAGSTATCVAPAADFGNCDTTKGPGCMAPAQCIGGTCVLPTPTSCP